MRPEDVAPLALHFLDVLAGELRQSEREITDEAMARLERYDWPGNARELRNVLERILLLTDAPVLDVEHLPDAIWSAQASGDDPLMVLPADGLSLEELERELICQALERTDGNKTGAARLLGVTRDTLRYRLEKYGID